jgi:hypothetical protein
MSAGPRVLLLTLSERTSAKGNPYMSGWLGKASVVAFRGEDDKHGHPTWDLFVSTPEPRPEAGQQKRPETVAQRAPARHQDGSDGWRGSAYRCQDQRRPEPAADEPFPDDSLADLYR